MLDLGYVVYSLGCILTCGDKGVTGHTRVESGCMMCGVWDVGFRTYVYVI